MPTDTDPQLKQSGFAACVAVRSSSRWASQMTLLRIATLPILLGSCLAFAQEGIQQLPATARSEVVKRCQSLKDGAEVALGDLNGDGVDDIAAIVQCIENGLEQSKIVVLMGTADGRFVFDVESASWEPHMRRTEYISIKQKSIHVTASSASYTDYAGTSYNFVLRGGAFVLAGLDYSEGQIGDQGGHGISANFLTKKLVSKRKASRQESHRVLKGDYRMPLSKFNLEEAIDALSLR